MKTYARLQDGRVMELQTAEGDISTRYHPALQWVDATGIAGIAIGWQYANGHWTPPLPAEPAESLSLADLQHRLSVLSSQIATLLGHN